MASIALRSGSEPLPSCSQRDTVACVTPATRAIWTWVRFSFLRRMNSIGVMACEYMRVRIGRQQFYAGAHLTLYADANNTSGMASLGQKIRSLRKRRNQTQAQFAGDLE